ncbi:MAG: hypothetical protein Aurels2KO_56230 [Aureliella sp.]
MQRSSGGAFLGEINVNSRHPLIPNVLSTKHIDTSMNSSSHLCGVLCSIALLFLFAHISVARPVQLGEPVRLATPDELPDKKLRIELNKKEVKRIENIDSKLVELDRRIRLYAAHLNHIASAIDAGRSKEQILSVLNNQPPSAKENFFRATHPRTDTQRMLSTHLIDQEKNEKPRENQPLEIERSFSAALLTLASKLASDIQRKDELLAARGEILLNENEIPRQDKDRTKQ